MLSTYRIESFWIPSSFRIVATDDLQTCGTSEKCIPVTQDRRGGPPRRWEYKDTERMKDTPMDVLSVDRSYTDALGIGLEQC